MRTSRYATSRQKACQQCSNAKAKCDRQNSGCTRCRQRGLPCVYRQAGPSEEYTLSSSSTTNDERETHSPVSMPDDFVSSLHEGNMDSWHLVPPTPLASRNASHTTGETPIPMAQSLSESRTISSLGDTPEFLDFSGLNLCCPINVDEIPTRWMNSYIPIPGKKVKTYPLGVLDFMTKILKAYAGAATRGRRLAFIHPTQMTDQQANSPLSTCLSLVRICENPLPGSEHAAMTVLQREMGNIIEQHTTYKNDLTLLSGFQAYLIYFLVLYFRLGESLNRLRSDTDDFIRQALINLQTIAHSASRQGLICVADQHKTRPRWEEWIVAEAKRRTLYAMYLFDGILASRDNLPIFLGTELRGLPIAASKYLWGATDRGDWERQYNLYLAEWSELGPTIDELWPIPDDMDELSIVKRRDRVDRWLEDVDEFGTMLYAVTVCTHGG
ncbi:uncharacterized protein N7496_003730 [Penicillium cataractarum]|uniref:Zn(2)-C6 fungal-type domain-containing protein n=1 Tax=Penicillium cataractarum TaxID=2100454 RepID=A0A9W9SN06_9EURO|nr:uncharacterized protein N7496_003730 [Penicillium cataractarum]KAJ5381302.1 hypothetical protein N7496_003730 [Penicillium cataractarum]